MIRARIKRWLSSFGKENPEAMRPRAGRLDYVTTGPVRPGRGTYVVQDVDVREGRQPLIVLAPETELDIDYKTDRRATSEPQRRYFQCFCRANKKGVYTGMYPLGARLVRVSFVCAHGEVWGEDMTKDEAQAFVKKEEETVAETKNIEKTESPFAVHKLNEHGMAQAKKIQEVFDDTLDDLKVIIGDAPSREMSLVVTKLQEAGFFAKRAMAVKPENQEK